MEENVHLPLMIGALGLCAIVGIYYCLVRKSALEREQLTQRLEAAFPSLAEANRRE